MTDFDALIKKLREAKRGNFVLSNEQRIILMRGILDLQLSGAKIDPLSDPNSFKGPKGPNDT
jgi:hypothetical protein